VAPARWRLLLRRPTFWVGAAILLFWIVCAIFGYKFAPYNPLAQQLLAANQAPSGHHPRHHPRYRPGPGHGLSRRLV
jgi:ABC-type dipeptide/oligopeptide/nickel transport system permease subunit